MYRVTNTHTAAYGIHDANGRCVYVPAGKTVEVDLDEATAASIISERGLLRIDQRPGKAPRVEAPAPTPEAVAAQAAADEEEEEAEAEERAKKVKAKGKKGKR